MQSKIELDQINSKILQIPNLIVIIRLFGSYDLYTSIVLEDFNELFEATEQTGKIAGLESRDIFITQMPPSWPLNLFTSLLESESMPKYWSVKPQRPKRITKCRNTAFLKTYTTIIS